MYKVLYIDDESEKLIETLRIWDEYSVEQGQSSLLPLQFVGLSFRNNDNQDDGGQAAGNATPEMHYLDVDVNIQKWGTYTVSEQDDLRRSMLRQLLEKITEIQPNAILLDIHLGVDEARLLSGKMLLEGIRRYYPHTAIVMATKTPPKVDDEWENYPFSEGLLDLSAGTHRQESYKSVCEACSRAIDYRGISKQVYEHKRVDLRLPDLSQEIIQEMVWSPLFEAGNNNYPIIFLDGCFGSSRRLFALWMNALLQRRSGEECFPSLLTEINCACLSTSFNNDKASQQYLERLFEPSRGRVLFLTDVDKVPDSMQKVFKNVVKTWRQNACIVATATDSMRVGFERLPQGIKKIQNYNDWNNLRGKEKDLISFLPSNEKDNFIGALEQASTKYKDINCSSFDYTVDNRDFEKQLEGLQEEIKNSQKSVCILAIEGNPTLLRTIPKAAKQAFRAWIDRIKATVCIMLKAMYRSSTDREFIRELISDNYITLDDTNKASGSIKNGQVLYFSTNIKTDGKSLGDFVQEKFGKKNDVVVCKCQDIFSSGLAEKQTYLREELFNMGEIQAYKVFFISDIDRVPNNYLKIFKGLVEEEVIARTRSSDKKYKNIDIRIVATVSDSRGIGLNNLPKDNGIIKIKLPSLQERFQGRSFIDDNDINSLLDPMYAGWNDIKERFQQESRNEIELLPSAIKEYYVQQIEALKELKSEEQQVVSQYSEILKNSTDSLTNISDNRFFQKLCISIGERLTTLSPQLKWGDGKWGDGGLSLGADILLAMQMQDWPDVIFNESRGIYALEKILKTAIRSAVTRARNATNNQAPQVKVSDIKISDFATEADARIEKGISDTITRPELGFELLTRAYAIEYERYHDNGSVEWEKREYAKLYKKFCDNSDKTIGEQPPPPYQSEPLVHSLGEGDFDSGLNIVNPLKIIVTQAKELLDE